jgi:hypothetical protein
MFPRSEEVDHIERDVVLPKQPVGADLAVVKSISARMIGLESECICRYTATSFSGCLLQSA